MYNSIIVGGLVRLWNLFYSLYENSFLKKLEDKIKRFFSYLFKHSIINRIFTSKDSLISKSGFYKLITKIILFIEKIFKFIHKFFIHISKGSWLFKSIQIGFKDNRHVLKTVSLFLVSLLMGIMLNSLLISRQGSIELYLLSIVFILIGIFVVKMASDYKDTLNNSSMWKFISGLFIIDEGGDQWW